LVVQTKSYQFVLLRLFNLLNSDEYLGIFKNLVFCTRMPSYVAAVQCGPGPLIWFLSLSLSLS